MAVGTFMVGYDLMAGQDYEPLIKQLKKYPKWQHRLDSTWLVQADCTTTKIRDELSGFLMKPDHLLVIKVTGAAWAPWNFGEDGNQWLRDNM